MSLPRVALASGLLAGLLCFAAIAQADSVTGFLYVTDYGSQKLDRYSYQYDTLSHVLNNFQPFGANGNTLSSVFINSNIKEGLQGTLNDIIVVDTGGSTLTRYDLNGNKIGTINVKNADNSAHAFSGIGNVVITNDGKFLYAPEEGGNVLDKVDLKTGKIVNTAAFQGAHDIAIGTDGTIFAAAYSQSGASGASASQGVYSFDANLGSKNQIIAFNDHSLTRPSGLTISNGVMYIQQNNTTTNPTDAVYQYALSGSGSATTATFSKSLASNALHFTFGNNVGPDGNLYIAALGGGSGRSFPGYTDGIYKYDTTTDAVSLSIGGRTEGSTASGSSGLVAPKYLQFGINFVPAEDAGFSTPEPGSWAMLGGMSLAGAGFLMRRKRRMR